MSLNSLSNSALSRVRPAAESRSTANAGADNARALESAPPSQTFNEQSGSDPQRFFEDLTRFIPTEMLAPYVSLLTVSAHKGWDAGKIYLAFIIATPIVFWFMHLVKIASNPNMAWPTWRELPRLLWMSLATTFAFAVWGLAPPTNPYQELIGGLEVIGLASTIVSLVLTGLDIIVTRLSMDAQAPRRRSASVTSSMPTLSPSSSSTSKSTSTT
ncbi:MAG: hypothetical protein KIH69_013315 [Anaerolineae bacterium]|nr:hypothetical protein [Anaerolineae bacterium]